MGAESRITNTPLLGAPADAKAADMGTLLRINFKYKGPAADFRATLPAGRTICCGQRLALEALGLR